MQSILKTSHAADTQLLRRLQRVERVCLLAAALIAGVVLTAWLVPPAAGLLPDGWSLMKANTALAALLCVAGFALEHESQTPRQSVSRRLCAVLVLILAASALAEHFNGQGSRLSTLLAADSDSSAPGLMSVQTAFGYLLIGCALLFRRQQAGWPGHLLDLLGSLMILLLLVLVAGYVYKVTALIGQSTALRVSPQTLWCFILLIFAQLSRRAPHGFYAPLVSVGIGGQIARILVPTSIAITYLLILVGLSVVARGHLPMSMGAALTAAVIVVMLVFSTLLMARRINALESGLRTTSLTDELTGLYNFRGLTLMGEQLLREARRGNHPISVIFIDADGLKEINDTLGHEAGSKMLVDIASLLRENFRDVDLLGRLGGDEFAVIVKGGSKDLDGMLERFKTAIEETNRRGENPYRIGCSLGLVTGGPQENLSLIDLLAHADAKMYENKRARKGGAGNDDKDRTEVPLSGC